MEPQNNTEIPAAPASGENQEQSPLVTPQLAQNAAEKLAVPLSEKAPLSSENICPNGTSETVAVDSKQVCQNADNLSIPISRMSLHSSEKPYSENICPNTANLPVFVPAVNTGAIKKRRDEKRKSRDQRSWDNMLESITNLPITERIYFIKEKYIELYNDYKAASSTLKTSEKQLKCIKREKEHVEADLAKNILTRSKLENLARELQKQNRDIKEENYNRLKDEEEKRKEVAASFTEKLNALTQLMDENKDKSSRLRNENLNMTSKLAELYEQFQERELHMSNMNRQMDLQKKLSDTQLKKLECEFEAEREIWKKDRAMMIINLERSDETNKVLQENVNSLQDHLNSYQKQYSDFETTMKRSNKVFDSLKDEMAHMHKINNVLERDRNEWHNRWEQTNNKWVSLMEVHKKTALDLDVTQKKLEALEKLCRKLTAERQCYLQELKQSNMNPITPVEEEGKVPQPVEKNSDESVQ
ncbi:alpha-taxilin-like isoform X2 [Diabrotica virgifera virgifera]|nr:alpha-taxilin-like isoform X2 [Diabrotica virgifera virgifera]XP_050519312.1 alpha-taxilin-like isoform X2 [Diabrotica virgifera virgifera]